MDDTATRLGAKTRTVSSSKLMGKQSGEKPTLGKVGDTQSGIGTLARIVKNNRIKINSIEKTIKSFGIKFKNIQKDNDQIKNYINKIDNKSDKSKDTTILKSILSELTSIRSSVENISSSIVQQQKNQEKVAETARISYNKQSKRDREAKLEEKSSDGGLRKLEEIAKPALSFFDMIINFLKNILLGGFLSWLINVIRDPQMLLKPIQDLINSIVGFFNGVIKWIDDTIIGPFRSVVSALNSGIKFLVDKINGIIDGLPDWFPFKPERITMSSEGPIPQIPELPKIPEATFANPNDVKSNEVQTLAAGGTVIQNQNNFGDTMLNMGIPPELMSIFGSIGDTFGRFSNLGINANQLGINGNVTRESGINIRGLGPDTQLVAVQPGEFILNKGVIDNMGVKPFMALNSTFGGSDANKPKMVSGGKIMAASGGGYAGGKIKYFSSNDRGNKILEPGKTYKFSDLRGHSHNPRMRQDGHPKDYTVLHGTDLNSSPNADIPAPLDAEVTHKQWFSGYGNGVRITTSAGPLFFAHLSRFGSINVGDKIKAGTIIGTQGNTGGSYADHLHIDSSPAGHEAFVNYITSGKPTFGSSTSASASESGSVSGSGSESESTSSSSGSSSSSATMFGGTTDILGLVYNYLYGSSSISSGSSGSSGSSNPSGGDGGSVTSGTSGSGTPGEVLASNAKTTYYDPSLGGINASGYKTASGLPATSTGEGYKPDVFSAAAFPPLLALLPREMTVPARNFPGGRTLKKPFNVIVTNSQGKKAVVRVNDVGPGVSGHSSNHMLDLSVAAKNYLGTGEGFKIEMAGSNSTPGAISEASSTQKIESSSTPPPIPSDSALNSMSNSQLNSLLDPTKTGASNPSVFAAAKRARELSASQGLSKEETERKVKIESIKASRAINSRGNRQIPGPTNTGGISGANIMAQTGSGKATGMQSTSSSANQTSVPQFNSEDSANPSSLVVKSIYNFIG